MISIVLDIYNSLNADLNVVKYSFISTFILTFSKACFAGMLSPMAMSVLTIVTPLNGVFSLLIPPNLLSDVIGMVVYRKHLIVRIFLKFIPGCFIGAFVGYLFLNASSLKTINISIGVFCIYLAIYGFYQKFIKDDSSVNNIASKPKGFLVTTFWGVLGGLCSTVASGGAAVTTFFLAGEHLSRFQMVGTIAYIGFSMNISRAIMYYKMGSLDLLHYYKLYPVLFLASILGYWVGVYSLKKISGKLFYVVGFSFMFITGATLIYKNC